MAFKAAQCPNCGGNIQVPDDRDRANCMYCGSSISVKEAVSAAGLPDAKNILSVAIKFIDSGNLGEADAQLTRVLEYESDNRIAWLCKAAVSANPAIVASLISHSIDSAIKLMDSFLNRAACSEIADVALKEKASGWFLQYAKNHISGGPRVCDSASNLLHKAQEFGNLKFLRTGFCLDAHSHLAWPWCVCERRFC